MTADSQAQRFLELLDEHRKILYKVANSYCRNPQERADLVQEMVAQLWSSFDRFDHRSRFSTWMYRVVLNVAISYYRAERRRSGSTVPLEDSMLELRAATPAPEAGSEDIRLLHQFIGRLDALNRALIILYLDGNSHETIAEILGISTTNVGTRVGRIKQQLRREFDRA
jgi:RNA polymerase sigma factor (sigma-70 family)